MVGSSVDNLILFHIFVPKRLLISFFFNWKEFTFKSVVFCKRPKNSLKIAENGKMISKVRSILQCRLAEPRHKISLCGPYFSYFNDRGNSRCFPFLG